jgi:histidinol-phosphatase (PHP family)
VRLTGDGHVHSEWSWDTGGPRSDAAGRMEAMCHRALKIGLPALAFTEHLDITGWAIGQEDLLNHLRPLVDANGVLTPELLDAGGYLDCIERCRWKFPELRILTGVELGQPHIDGDGARRLVDLSALDRVNGSLHTLPVPEAPEAVRCEPITLYRRWPAERVVRDYLAEVHQVISGSDAFAVFTHIEYAVRDWPTQTEGPFNPRTFEDEFRQAMRAVAGSGRALELNVGGPIRPWIAQWWSEEGGRAITLASDAHTP